MTKWAKPHFLHPAWWSEPSGPPAPVFNTHDDWAHTQGFQGAIMAALQDHRNARDHHCRIGKIRLK